MSRYHKRLSRLQRNKQLDERNQANFRESYLDHIVETAHIGVRNFANPLILGRKRKKPKHESLNALITYLHQKNGISINTAEEDNDIEMKTNSNTKRTQRDYDNITSFQRKRKRRKLRHSIAQIRNNKNVQNALYKASKYSNIVQNNEQSNSYCVWKFHHQRNKSEETMYESDYRCVLCLKYFETIYTLHKHLILWHSKLTFDIKIINAHLHTVNVLCKPSKMCYKSFMENTNNIGLNEYYFGWINIWNNYYLKCDTQMRKDINDKHFTLNYANDTETDIDIDKLYENKWNFHNELSLKMKSSQHKSLYDSRRRNKKHRIDIISTFKLSCNQFKNRRVSSLSNKEKLLLVEEVLKYPLMNGRMSKLCKYIGLKNIKYLKKLMAVYPMLLLLNRRQISLHLVSKWNEWKCNIKKGIVCENVSNNELKGISLKEILERVRANEKGISALIAKDKLWLCTYILSQGGKRFISSFREHLQCADGLSEEDMSTNITNSALYNIYYNFCGFMMLCGQFPLSNQGMNAIKKWWNEVRRVFGFGIYNHNNVYRRNNIKMTKKHKTARNKSRSPSKRRNIYLNEKATAIRDIIYGKKGIEEYMSQFNVKERTILRWINNSKNILQKCEAQCGLDDIWGIYTDQNTLPTQTITVVSVPTQQTTVTEATNVVSTDIEMKEQNTDEPKEETQFKVFLDKATEYLQQRKPKKTAKKSDKQEMDYSSEGSDYDPMNESARNRRVASMANKGFDREYKTRNLNERRGRQLQRSYELRYNKGYYHGSTFARVQNENAYVNSHRDSENECSDDWLLEWEKNLLFDFEDISFGEKSMMRYWNEFIRKRNKNKIYASFMVPVKLIEFAVTHKEIIVENHLKMSFLFHCIALWEFGFIEAKCIQEAMYIVHQYQKSKDQNEKDTDNNSNSVSNQ